MSATGSQYCRYHRRRYLHHHRPSGGESLLRNRRSVVDRGSAQADTSSPLRAEAVLHISRSTSLPSWSRAEPIATRSSVYQHALARFDPNGATHHLIRRKEDQHECFCRVEPPQEREPTPLWQADELGICTPHWQCSNHLSWFQRVCAHTCLSTTPTRSHPGVNGGRGASGCTLRASLGLVKKRL